MQDRGRLGIALVAPALAAVLVLFIYPLGYSLVTAFEAKGGGFTFGTFAKAFEFYSVDIGFTLVIIGLSTILIGLASIAIGGYLVLGENPWAVGWRAVYLLERRNNRWAVIHSAFPASG